MDAIKSVNIEIRIEKAAFGGDGIATVDGKICFVEGVLPGETVIARVVQNKKNFCRAKLVKILEPSPFRVPAPCPYIDACGGCQYQHVSYPEELRIKEDQVREIITRISGDGNVVKSIVPSSADYGARNSVTLHRTQKESAKPQRLGFVGRDNKTVLPIDNCLLADSRLKDIFRASFLLKKGVDKVRLRVSATDQIVSDQEDVFMRIPLGGKNLVVHSKGFFQNNLPVADRLARLVGEWTRQAAPGVFFDLFAGVGTFGLLAAPQVPKVIFIEENKDNLDALRMNVAESDLREGQVIHGRAEKVFESIFPKYREEKTMVCVDPPRSGLEGAITQFLSGEGRAHSLVYISCDLATLARDLKILLRTGGYRLAQVIPFDMFPRTKHIEIATLLTADH
jgi:23S rRNA (uracil1939-C5)-methyltransferase